MNMKRHRPRARGATLDRGYEGGTKSRGRDGKFETRTILEAKLGAEIDARSRGPCQISTAARTGPSWTCRICGMAFASDVRWLNWRITCCAMSPRFERRLPSSKLRKMMARCC